MKRVITTATFFYLCYYSPYHMTPIKALLVARVSTKDQEEEGYSLSSQENLLDTYAEKKNFEIVKRFVFPESASGKKKRKIQAEILTYLKKNQDVTVMLCEKVDRMTRNFKDAVALNEWLEANVERQIHFVKQNLILHKHSKSNEKFQWDIYLAMARQYSNNLAEEAKKGLDQKALSGWYPGNSKRGYKSLGEVGRKIWVIDTSPDSEAPFIQKLFKLMNEGDDRGTYTTMTVGKRLFEDGWKTKDGKPVGKSVIHEILTDCFYCSEFDWNGEHYPDGKHEPLIHPARVLAKEVFYSVQARLKRKTNGKYRKHDFLFRDLTCGECGRSIVGQMQKGHAYYSCTRYGTTCSQRKYVREEVIQEQVVALLDQFQVDCPETLEWIRDALRESHADEIQYHTTIMDSLTKQLTATQKRLDNLYDDKMDEKITKEMYDRKFDQYTKEQATILEAIKNHKQANINYLQLGANIFELAQQGQKLYEEMATATEKRSLLNFVFSNLSLKDKKLLPDYKNGFQIIAKRSVERDWLGRRDSNPRMVAPEATALPLGDSPMKPVRQAS